MNGHANNMASSSSSVITTTKSTDVVFAIPTTAATTKPSSYYNNTFPNKANRRTAQKSIRSVLLVISFCLLLVLLLWYDARGFRAVDSASVLSNHLMDQVLLTGPTTTTTTTTIIKSSSSTSKIATNNSMNSTSNLEEQPVSARTIQKWDYSDYLLDYVVRPEEKTQICYNSQGTLSNYWRIKNRFQRAFNNVTSSSLSSLSSLDNNKISKEPTYRFVYHAFDEPCPDDCLDCDGCLHLNFKSTPAEGRNAAVLHTVNSTTWHKCKYLVFFDDDAYLLPSSVDNKKKYNTTTPKEDDSQTLLAWRQIHEMLLNDNTTHPLIAPRSELRDQTEVGMNIDSYQSCVDEIWWAIRHDHVDFVYPLSTIGRDNFWLTNVAMWYVMERCYPAGVFVDPRWYTKNEAHRYLETIKRSKPIYKDPRYKIKNMKAMLKRDFGDVGPFKVTKNSWLEHSCNVKFQPSLGVHPRCKKVTEERFAKWLSGEFEP